MKRTIRYYRLSWTRHDLPAGLTVFFVALPLCLGIALASGAPLYAGIISGVIGGVVVAAISGSALGVSGPAAGLTTLVASAIVSLGDFSVFLLTVIIAGLFQLLLGILKAGGIANYFPSAVIKGMMAAIGIILLSKQIPLAAGYDQPDFWSEGFLQLFANTHLKSNFLSLYTHFNKGTIVISVLSLLALFGWERTTSKKLKKIPGPLAAVIISVAASFFFTQWVPALALHKNQLVQIPLNLLEEFQFPAWNKLFSNFEIWKYGLLIGSLASLETLLCVEAVDKLDKQNRISPVNRELFAQGVGNIACGILGGIPVTAVVVRGAANANAGARTKMSAITHGAFLLIVVMLIPSWLNYIPLSSLAAILIVTGYRLTRPSLFESMWKLGRKQFYPFIITIVVILATDLLIGVSIGLLLSIFFIVQSNFKTEYRVTKRRVHDTEHIDIKLHTNVTFLNKVKLRDILDRIPEYSVLHIDGSECNFIDYDIREIVSEFVNKAKNKHIQLRISGIEQVEISSVH